MVDEKQALTVIDLGLARLVDSKTGVYKDPTEPADLPDRWMAPEALGANGVSSPASDVWMFASTIYEILKRDDPPEASEGGAAGQDGLRDRERQMLLDIRRDCPEQILQLLSSCFQPDPRQRPTTDDIVRQVSLPCRMRSGFRLLLRCCRWNRISGLRTALFR